MEPIQKTEGIGSCPKDEKNIRGFPDEIPDTLIGDRVGKKLQENNTGSTSGHVFQQRYVLNFYHRYQPFRFFMIYRGRCFVSIRIFPMYSPRMPMAMSWMPPRKSTDTIVEVYPLTTSFRMMAKYRSATM